MAESQNKYTLSFLIKVVFVRFCLISTFLVNMSLQYQQHNN